MEKLGCCITDLLSSVAKYEVGHKCDMSLSLYADKDSETPECTHRMSANARHNLLKLMALIGTVAAGFALLGAICSCICGNRRCK